MFQTRCKVKTNKLVNQLFFQPRFHRLFLTDLFCVWFFSPLKDYQILIILFLWKHPKKTILRIQKYSIFPCYIQYRFFLKFPSFVLHWFIGILKGPVILFLNISQLRINWLFDYKFDKHKGHSTNHTGIL